MDGSRIQRIFVRMSRILHSSVRLLLPFPIATERPAIREQFRSNF